MSEPKEAKAEKEAKFEPKTVNVCEFTVTRSLSGTKIWIKSARIEELMKEWQGSRRDYAPDQAGEMNDQTQYLRGHRAYAVTALPILPSGRRPWAPLHQGIYVQNGFNLKYLSLKGIGAGLEIKIDVPLSKSMIQDLGKSFKEGVAELLSEYSKPVSLSVTVTEKELAPPAAAVVPPADPVGK